MTLFSDEKEAMDQMSQDGLPMDEAIGIIKSRRQKLLGGDAVDNKEHEALKQMQNDGLSAEESASLILSRRQHIQDHAEDIKDQHADESV